MWHTGLWAIKHLSLTRYECERCLPHHSLQSPQSISSHHALRPSESALPIQSLARVDRSMCRSHRVAVDATGIVVLRMSGRRIRPVEYDFAPIRETALAITGVCVVTILRSLAISRAARAAVEFAWRDSRAPMGCSRGEDREIGQGADPIGSDVTHIVQSTALRRTCARQSIRY